MAGTYSVGETKTRPGVYHRRYSVGGGELAGALNGVGMGIIRANWGPLNKAVAFEPSTNVNAVFGNGKHRGPYHRNVFRWHFQRLFCPLWHRRAPRPPLP